MKRYPTTKSGNINSFGSGISIDPLAKHPTQHQKNHTVGHKPSTHYFAGAMIVDYFVFHSFKSAVLWIFAAILIKVSINKFGRGLNNIPGPWLASFTDLWRLFVVWGRRPELAHIKLHKKYGKVVRLGPRAVSVGDPQAIAIIYGLNAGCTKVCTSALTFQIHTCWPF